MIKDQNPCNLDQIQQWMQTVIMHPDGIVAGMASERARDQIDIDPDQIEKIVRRSHRQTSTERMQIYANAYYARLVECLREEFPALAHTLGEETFDGFAFHYLQEHPSQSYTLAHLGKNFPRYLTETRPEDLETPSSGPTWVDFLIDVATVERLYSEVFDGPGVEGKPILLQEDLAKIPTEVWPEARLVPVPCLQLVALQYPVHDYISAVRHHEEATIPEASPTFLVVTRREYIVRRTAVSRLEYDLLQALVDGESVGAAIERVASAPDGDIETLETDLPQWFQTWASAGYFQAIEYPT